MPNQPALNRVEQAKAILTEMRNLPGFGEYKTDPAEWKPLQKRLSDLFIGMSQEEQDEINLWRRKTSTLEYERIAAAKEEIDMSANIITTVKGYIPDKEMPFLDDMDPYEGAWGDKDRNFDQIRVAMEDTWDLYTEHIISEFTPISTQGNAGTCVANAWCDAVEMLIGLKYGRNAVVQLSRRFAYWISRYLHSATDEEKGTFLRALGHQFRKVGVILEEVMPYSDKLEDLVGQKASPKLEYYTMASNNRIKGFYRLSQNVEQMLKEAEIAVRSNHPVIFGVPVSREFTQARGMHTFDPPDVSIGNHCMLVTGVRYKAMRQWLIRNSWSWNWGENGHCWITDSYLGLSNDTWVGTLIERLI